MRSELQQGIGAGVGETSRSPSAMPKARPFAPHGDAIGVVGRELPMDGLLPPLPNAIEQQEMIDFLAREILALRDRLEAMEAK